MHDIDIDIKNFVWEGKGYTIDRRRRNELHYKAFCYGDLRIQLGDFVLVRNDDSQEPEGYMFCFIAQVKDLYESEENADEPHRAVVQWFSRTIEIPHQFSRSIQDADYYYEVVEEHRPHWSHVIDAESIFGKCSVIFLSPKVSPKVFAEQNVKRDIPFFYCRWKFTGTALECKIPVFDSNSMKANRKGKKHSTRKGLLSHNGDSCPSSKNSSRSSSPVPIPNHAVPKKAKVLVKKITSKKKKHVASKKKVEGFIDKSEQSSETEMNSWHLPFIPEDKNEQDHAVPKKTKVLVKKIVASKKKKHVSKAKVEGFSKKIEQSSDTEAEMDNLHLPFVPDDKNEQGGQKENGACVTPVKKFYSPTKKPSRILTNSPYLKTQSARHAQERDEKSKSERKKYESPGNENEPSDKCKISVSSARRSLFQDYLEDLPRSPKQKIRSWSVMQDAGRDQGQVTTTRYGRTVKPVYSQPSTNDNETEDTIRLKMGTIPKKQPSANRRLKFYNSDVSDCESVYSPSSKSCSEDEDEEDLNDNEMPMKQERSQKSRKSVSSQRKGTRISNATPKVPERSEPLRTPGSRLEMSRQRLHVSAVPTSLPCREEEYADIYTFVESNLSNRTGGCMYISGVPGTGKTATVFEVMRNLQKERDCGNIPQFKFVEVNGMRMTEPHQCYVQVHKILTGEIVTTQQAADLLEKRFTKPGPRKEPVVLLVDELDLLWTRKQTVMYNLFDWPSKPHSKLIVIAIANAMDLPERLMLSRISSRLGLTRKTFQPYNFKQLQDIVMCRIRELETFDPDAVQLVARKVAAVSGDARRALDVCRRAAEIAEEGRIQISPQKRALKALVGISHVDLAHQEMFTSPMIMAIRSSSDMQKLFLQSLVSEFGRTGLEETTFSKVYHQLVALCRFEGILPPNTSQIFALCSLLSSSRLILVDSSENDIHMKVRLNVSIDDVNYALNERNS